MIIVMKFLSLLSFFTLATVASAQSFNADLDRYYSEQIKKNPPFIFRKTWGDKPSSFLPASNMSIAPNTPTYQGNSNMPFMPLITYRVPEYKWAGGYQETGKIFTLAYMPPPPVSGNPNIFYSWKIVSVKPNSNGGFEYSLVLWRQTTPQPTTPKPKTKSIYILDLKTGKIELNDVPVETTPKPRSDLREPIMRVPNNK